MTFDVGMPTDESQPATCSECGFDSVVAFPVFALDPTGVTALGPIRVCVRCFDQRAQEETT